MATSKFFSNPGSPKSAIEYLLDEKHQPEVMRGNPQSFLDLANSLDFKNTYTSGVIRTTETMTNEQMQFVMDEYTQFLTAGLRVPPEVLWVKHYEHEQTELHFVVPNVDLESGRAFQPYAHKRDLKRRDALDNIINSKFDFHDPDDPANQRFTASDKDYLRTSKDRKGLAEAVDKAISESLVATIQNGGIYDRKAVVSDLKTLGFEVKERGKSISIKNEMMQKPMRLKGSFYEPTAKFDEKSFEAIEQASARYRESRTERLADNEQEYKRLTGTRIQQVEKRYSQSWKAKQKSRLDDVNRSFERSDSISPSTLFFDENNGRQSKRALSGANADRQLQPSQQAENTESDKRHVSSDTRGNDTELQLQRSVQNRVIPCYYKDREIGQVVDKGDKLQAKDFRSNKAAALNIVKEGKKKGWRSMEFTGNEDFLKHAFEYAIKNGIEVNAKNKAQEKLLQEVKENDRVRKDAVRTVEKARERASGATQANADYKKRKPDFKQKIGQFDKSYGAVKMQRNDELEKFKTDINMVDYARTLGFEVVKKESTAKSVKMKDGQQTIIISTDTDGHGIYFNAQSNKSGSIIDLVQEFKNMNLGQVRKELRPFIGRDSNARTEREHYTPKPKASSKDEMAVANAYAKTQALLTHPYLTKRGISEKTQSHWIFQGKFRIDERQNVIFPHYDSKGVCGFEKKNQDFTGFSSGGEKGVWFSNNLKSASKVVVVESAIDAMSYAQLNKTMDEVAFISVGGQPTVKQFDIIRRIESKYNPTFVIATDNDQGGASISSQITSQLQNANYEHHTPQQKDWNDALKEHIKQQQQSKSPSMSI